MLETQLNYVTPDLGVATPQSTFPYHSSALGANSANSMEAFTQIYTWPGGWGRALLGPIDGSQSGPAGAQVFWPSVNRSVSSPAYLSLSLSLSLFVCEYLCVLRVCVRVNYISLAFVQSSLKLNYKFLPAFRQSVFLLLLFLSLLLLLLFGHTWPKPGSKSIKFSARRIVFGNSCSKLLASDN